MDDDSRPPSWGGWRSEIGFLRRALIVVAIVVLTLALWEARAALMLAFAAVVVAVLLLAVARPFRTRLGFGQGWALAAAGLAITGCLALAGVLIGSTVATQVAELWSRLPQAAAALEQRFGVDVPGLGEDQGDGGLASGQGGLTGQVGLPEVGGLVARVVSIGRALVDGASALGLAIVGGAFIAANPGMYRRGVVMLLPVSRHAQAEHLLDTTGAALHQWLLATLLSMALVGLLVALGAWLIGLPAPLALGLFAGLAEFVPVIGPFLGAVPALLLALPLGLETVLWTAGLFIVVQQIESNLVMPLVQKRLVDVPPALLLLAVVAFGAVLGLPGVILAAPLTVVAFVGVKALYVRHTLGEAVEVPGEKEKG